MKVVKFFKDVRTIILGIISIGGIILWLGSQYFITVAEADARELKQMRRDLAGLQIRLGFSDTDNNKQMYRALIEMQENQIKLFKGE